jgi:hypothetical protein
MSRTHLSENNRNFRAFLGMMIEGRRAVEVEGQRQFRALRPLRIDHGPAGVYRNDHFPWTKEEGGPRKG